MGRKDAQHCFAPVDQHRKQIGKHDWKKSKKDVKQMKTRADQNAPTSTQHIVLYLGLGMAVVVILYMLLFWYLGLAAVEDIARTNPPV